MISKNELEQSRRGLLQLRGVLLEKKAALQKQNGELKKIAVAQEAPDWAIRVMEEYNRALDPDHPYQYARVLSILRQHKIL
jgi:hypothetical protein